MTEEEMVNVRGEISDSGVENGDDQSKSKDSLCNGDSSAIENDEGKAVVVIDNGDGKVDGDDGSCKIVGGSETVAAAADSSVQDLNVGENNGPPASEGVQLQLDLEHKVDDEALDESEVATVSKAAEAECKCESQLLNNTAKECKDASVASSCPAEEICETEVTDSVVSIEVDGENVGREGESVYVEECADAQKVSGEEKARIGGVENDDSVSVTDLNMSKEYENIVGADADVSGDENRSHDHEYRSVVGTDADVLGDEDKSHDDEFKTVVGADADVQSGLANTDRSECTELNEIPVDVVKVSAKDAEEYVDEDAQKKSADETAQIESVSVTDMNTNHKCYSGGGDEKDTATVVEGRNESTDVNKSMVGIDLPNSSGEMEQSECREENEIPVVDVAVISTTDVEECADEDAQKSSVDETAPVKSVSVTDANSSREFNSRGGDEKDLGTVVQVGNESITVTDVDKSIVGTDVPNGLAEMEKSECPEENEIPNDVIVVSAKDVEGYADEDALKSLADRTAQVKSVSVTDVNSSHKIDSGGGDEKDPEIVVLGGNESISVTDVDKIIVGADVPNSLAETEQSECPEENEIPNDVVVVSATDVEECADEDAQKSSVDKMAQIESVSVTDANRSHEFNSGGGDEKDIGSDVQGGNESVSVTDVNKSVVGTDVPNGLAETEQREYHEENEIPVDVVAVSATDVEECADEDAQNSLADEKAEVKSVSVTDLNTSHECYSGNGDDKELGTVVHGISESVSVTDVNKSHVGTDVTHGLAKMEQSESSEDNEIPVEDEPVSKLERLDEDSGHELVPEAENLSAPSCTDMPGDGNVISDNNDNAVESEGEPSVDMSGMNDNGVESEGEPSAEMPDMKNNAVESESEPSVESEGGNHGDEVSRPSQEGSNTDILDGQNISSEVGKKPFYYLIRIPRYDDENIKEQIRYALHQVEEKTKARDAIRAEIQIKKATCKECGQDVRDASSAERAARDLLKSKRQEIDSVQSTMNRLNNAISVEDIDGRIRNMEHMIEHETLPLKEEKQLLRQIKQLKQNREELSSNIGMQDQLSLDNKDNVEEHFKRLQLLRKELDSLRDNVLRADAVTKAAKKKYDDEYNKLSELLARFKAADDIRQEAYAKLQALRKQLYEKNQYFWDYKNAANKGHELAAEGKREELQCFCVNQVEKIMELWNKNDEFRRDYTRCNTRSTLRRLRTLDGRSLGPDEEPPVIPNALTERVSKNNSVSLQSTLEQENKSIAAELVNIKDEPVSNVAVPRSQSPKAKKPAKPAPLEKSSVVVSSWDEAEDEREEPVRTKEEEEKILEAERVRKEEEAARLKEQRRIDEIEKAEAARKRKERNEEKAKQRAILKQQKEDDKKKKEKEKKARKKERKNAVASDTADNVEQESAPGSETLAKSMEESNQTEKPVEVTKRLQKPSQFMRHTKAKSLPPPPLRNRGKKRIQSWMWVLITVLVVVALLYLGNNTALRSGLQSFGF